MSGSACDAMMAASLLGGEIPCHAQVELAVGQVATRVDDGAGVAIDDQELVGLHGVAGFVRQVAEHQHPVAVVVVQEGRHGA